MENNIQDSTQGVRNNAADEEALGDLSQLVGTWKNTSTLKNHGYNMIPLPVDFRPFHYKLLLNQYNEQLTFKIADAASINRGKTGDQKLAALAYEQEIFQSCAAEYPEREFDEKYPGGQMNLEPGSKIHFETGMWLNIRNQITNNLNIARMGTIPHGDAVLAMGQSSVADGAPIIEDISGLPNEYKTLGDNLADKYKDPQSGEVLDPATMDDEFRTEFDKKFYLAPYQHFQLNPFKGHFDPVYPNRFLSTVNEDVNIVKTTKLEVDTSLESGGIVNTPFVVKNAEASDMKATFWIQELAEKDKYGNPKLRLQYSQLVFLDFYFLIPDREKTRWPHVSINTLEKVVD
jgi:hypothetical protein